MLLYTHGACEPNCQCEGEASRIRLGLRRHDVLKGTLRALPPCWCLTCAGYLMTVAQALGSAGNVSDAMRSLPRTSMQPCWAGCHLPFCCKCSCCSCSRKSQLNRYCVWVTTTQCSQCTIVSNSNFTFAMSLRTSRSSRTNIRWGTQQANDSDAY